MIGLVKNFDCVLKKFSYRYQEGRISLVTFTSENNQSLTEHSYQVVLPEEEDEADFFLFIIDDQKEQTQNGLRIFDQQNYTTLTCYDENVLANYHLFRENCKTHMNERGLKRVSVTPS